MTDMEEIAIDEADLRLLDLLQTDASQSNQSLAEQAHLSPPTSLRRIKRLRELGVIERDIALLHGRDGLEGETVLRYSTAPKVEVLAGRVQSRWDAAKGGGALAGRRSRVVGVADVRAFSL